MKKNVFAQFQQILLYFAGGYFLQIVLFTVYTYPVGLQHKKKGRKLNRESHIEVKLPKTNCKWFNVNAQSVLMKVLLYVCSLHNIQNSDNIKRSHNLKELSPRTHLTAISISCAKTFSRLESSRKIHFLFMC